MSQYNIIKMFGFFSDLVFELVDLNRKELEHMEFFIKLGGKRDIYGII